MYSFKKLCFELNQALRPGLAYMKPRRRMISAAGAMGLCLFLVGSCNSSFSTFLNPGNVDLENVSSSRVVQYAYALQENLAEQPARFMKLDPARVKLALAHPDLERVESHMAVWQYRSDSCVLDLYLDTRAGEITHYEFRPRNIHDAEDEFSDWACLQQMYQSRRQLIEANLESLQAKG